MNVDTTDEDAADLQFPKDWTLSQCDDDSELEVPVRRKELLTSADSACFVCKSSITEPFIRCAICSRVELCPPCFAKGQEKGCHKNDHDYIVVRNEFVLITQSRWTAKEEVALLDAVLECGFGNWEDISRRLSTIRKRSAEECKKHYMRFFIDGQCFDELPKLNENSSSLFGSEVIPYRFKLDGLDDPPRNEPFSMNSKMMSGYNAARADFQTNFDNYAELTISNLKYDDFDEDDPCFEQAQELQAAIVSAYNDRLKERFRRRKVIRDHGLISSRKMAIYNRMYERTLSKFNFERLKIFCQLVNGMQFDYLVEGLRRVEELKNQLERLYEYRENGLKYFHSISTFEELTKQREEADKERKNYLDCAAYDWRNILAVEVSNINPSPMTVVNTGRKKAPPISVRGMPDYDKLQKDEQELCSTVRLFPSQFLEFKHMLINENKKMGYVKLAQARSLLKIDVNKTRKIFDFLLNSGHINTLKS